MSCERYAEHLSDLIDGEIEDAARAETEAHLERCPSCRAIAADLRRIRTAAGALTPHVPPVHVWPRLQERLAVTSTSSPREENVGHASREALWSWRWLAVAASLVLVTGLSVWLVRSMTQPGSRPPGAPAPVDATAMVESVESELEAAEGHYQRAIAGLEQIAQAEQAALDPTVAADLQLSMTVLDDAIAESRAALGSEPESRSARSSLFEALRRKVALLQDTISLMNEMRKGDEVGVGRIVSELNES